jgi:hypothetical protein
MADNLCQKMPSHFNSEVARRAAFEKIIHPLDQKLESREWFILSAKNSTANGSTSKLGAVKTIKYEGGHLVLLLEGFEVESTEDAYMQICRAYEVYVRTQRTRPS